MKTFNASALLNLVASVWEEHFKIRILSHTYNRVEAYKLSYDKLLKRLPEQAAGSITLIGDSLFRVPSAPGKEYYKVSLDIRMRTREPVEALWRASSSMKNTKNVCYELGDLEQEMVKNFHVTKSRTTHYSVSKNRS